MKQHLNILQQPQERATTRLSKTSLHRVTIKLRRQIKTLRRKVKHSQRVMGKRDFPHTAPVKHTQFLTAAQGISSTQIIEFVINFRPKKI